VDEANGSWKLIPGNGLTVLVVGDDGAVRDKVVRSLRLLGFGAVTAGDFSQALRLCREYDVRLLVVSGGLPGPGAGVLADVLSATYPGLKVLVVAGAPLDCLPWRGVGADAPILPMPFGLAQLVRAVSAALNKPSPRVGCREWAGTSGARAGSAAGFLAQGSLVEMSA
jgi:DNA-binding response OmpR family regulator